MKAPVRKVMGAAAVSGVLDLPVALEAAGRRRGEERWGEAGKRWHWLRGLMLGRMEMRMTG